MTTPMLTVRSSQLSVLGHDVDQRFIDSLVARFLHLLPDPVALRERILSARQRCARYGVLANQDLEWFVELELTRGPEWELQPAMNWTLEFLDNPKVDLAGRRFRLEKLLKRWDAYAG